MFQPERSQKAEDAVKQVLYELGFLNKKGDTERNKERRWKMNINEAELILKDFMNDIKTLQRKESDYRQIISDLQRTLYNLVDGLKEEIKKTENQIEESLQRASDMSPYEK